MSDEKAFILQFIADNQDVRYLDIVGQPYFNGRKTLVKPLVNNLLDQKLLSVKGVAINLAADNPILHITLYGQEILADYNKEHNQLTQIQKQTKRKIKKCSTRKAKGKIDNHYIHTNADKSSTRFWAILGIIATILAPILAPLLTKIFQSFYHALISAFG